MAALGHRRLSIIDLAGGSQPMTSHDGRFTVVFNGEIYNYIEIRDELLARGARFTTSSDTEVILEAWRAWGADCLPRFRGMFAFALHDDVDAHRCAGQGSVRQEAAVPRRAADGFGTGAGVRFRNSSAARSPGSAMPNSTSTRCHQYLCWRYAPGPFTFFRGIRKLPPGSYLTWQAGVMKTQRYWTAPEETALHRTPPSDPIAAFLDVFDEAVRLRLRADVPLGAFLSGRARTPRRSSRRWPISAPRNCEPFPSVSGMIRLRNCLLPPKPPVEIGTTHTPLELAPNDLTTLLPMLSRHRGAPIAETCRSADLHAVGGGGETREGHPVG